MLRRSSTASVLQPHLPRQPLSLSQLQAKIKEDVLEKMQLEREVELQTNAIFQAIERKLKIYIALPFETEEYNLFRLTEQIASLATPPTDPKALWILQEVKRPLQLILQSHHLYYNNSTFSITAYLPLDRSVIFEPAYKRYTEFFKLAFTDELEEIKWRLPVEAGMQRLVGAEIITASISKDINDCLAMINRPGNSYIAMHNAATSISQKYALLLGDKNYYPQFQSFISSIFLIPLSTILINLKVIADAVGANKPNPILEEKMLEWIQRRTPDGRSSHNLFLREIMTLPTRATQETPKLECQFNGIELPPIIIMDILRNPGFIEDSNAEEQNSLVTRVKYHLRNAEINEEFLDHLCTHLHQSAMLSLVKSLQDFDMFLHVNSPIQRRKTIVEEYKRVFIDSKENSLSVKISFYVIFKSAMEQAAIPIDCCTQMTVTYDLVKNITNPTDLTKNITAPKILYLNPRVEFSGPSCQETHRLFNNAMLNNLPRSAPSSPLPQKTTSGSRSPTPLPPSFSGSAPTSPVAASSPVRPADPAAGVATRKAPPKRLPGSEQPGAESSLASPIDSPASSPVKSAAPRSAPSPEWKGDIDGEPNWRDRLKKL